MRLHGLIKDKILLIQLDQFPKFVCHFLYSAENLIIFLLLSPNYSALAPLGGRCVIFRPDKLYPLFWGGGSKLFFHK